MDTFNEAKPMLQVRGKIDSKSPLYELCKTSEASLFRTLKALAEEAVAVRTKLAPQNGLEHPLRHQISNMTSSEAVTYLLGITKSAGSVAQFNLSDRIVAPSGDNVQQTQGSIAIGKELTPSGSSGKQAEAFDDGWENDMADAMEALSGLPESK